MRTFLSFTILFLLFSCQNRSKTGPKSIDIQGHRGCRGLYPENSIPGFIHALDLGVNTLELDVVITKDKQVILSHEPFLSHEICLDSLGYEITEANEKKWNIYEMNYVPGVKNCDCGSKIHPRFLNQHKIKIYKPMLRHVFDSVETYLALHNRTPIQYNIEIKSTPEGDGIYHPLPAEFASLVLSVIHAKKIESQCTIQSFDIRALEEVHRQNPNIKTALLVENTDGIQNNLNKLSFKPNIYSPDFTLINKDSVSNLHKQEIMVIPWTVNKIEDIKSVLNMQVDGIISDYPDSVLMVIQR